MRNLATLAPVPTKQPRVVFICPPEIKERLEEIATKNLRTLSNQVLAIVVDYLERLDKEETDK